MVNTAEEYAYLGEDGVPGGYIRIAVEEASIEVWLEVIKGFPELRRIVAHNKPIQIEILEILAFDPDEEVRAEVSNRRKLNLPLFAALATDTSRLVLGGIVQNPKVPTGVLELLLKDPDECIREVAPEKLNKRSFGLKDNS